MTCESGRSYKGTLWEKGEDSNYVAEHLTSYLCCEILINYLSSKIYFVSCSLDAVSFKLFKMN